MTTGLKKITQKIKNLPEYLILKQERDFLIIETKITIKEHKEVLGNPFQPWSRNIDKTFSICFVIITEQTPLDSIIEFKERKIPTVCLSNEDILGTPEELASTLKSFKNYI